MSVNTLEARTFSYVLTIYARELRLAYCFLWKRLVVSGQFKNCNYVLKLTGWTSVKTFNKYYDKVGLPYMG